MVAEEDPWADRDDFLQEVLVSRFEKRRFQTETINAMPLYPTETILWDENQIPNVHYTGKLFYSHLGEVPFRSSISSELDLS